MFFAWRVSFSALARFSTAEAISNIAHANKNSHAASYLRLPRAWWVTVRTLDENGVLLLDVLLLLRHLTSSIEGNLIEQIQT